MLTSWNEYHTESSLLPAAGLLIPILLAVNLLKSVLWLSSLPTVNSFQLAPCWPLWCRDPEAQVLHGFELHLSLSRVINILIPECAAAIFIRTTVQRQQSLLQNSPWRGAGRCLVNDWVWERGAGGHLPQLCGATAPWWELRRISKHTFGCDGLGRISAGAQTNCPAALFVLGVTWGCDFNSQLYGDQNGEYSWVFSSVLGRTFALQCGY